MAARRACRVSDVACIHRGTGGFRFAHAAYLRGAAHGHAPVAPPALAEPFQGRRATGLQPDIRCDFGLFELCSEASVLA